MNIRTVNEIDGLVLRDIHLRMYGDAPNAFCETLEAAHAMSAEQWDVRAREYSESDKARAWIAWEGDAAVGFMAGYVGQYRDEGMHWDVTDVVTLSRAWIDPSMRRCGVGRRLARSVKDWAVEKKARTLETQVTENNVAAIQFYRALSFIDTGRREPLCSNRSLAICFLSQSLGDGPCPVS